MQGIKVVFENFCAETGVTTVIVQSEFDGKRYSGTAMCHPDDTEYKSRLFGTKVAGMRAVTKALKVKLRSYKRILKELLLLQENGTSSKTLFSRINFYENEIKELKRMIELGSYKQIVRESEDFIKQKQIFQEHLAACKKKKEDFNEKRLQLLKLAKRKK